MKRIKRIVMLGALMIAIYANAQQKPWTLQQCVDTALANNRNIKQREITRKTNEIAWKQARLNLMPDLSASASHNFQWGRALTENNTYSNSTTFSQSSNFGLNSSLTLFDGLRMKYNIDARLSNLKASEADMERVRQDIVMTVSTAYLQVLLNKELLQVAFDQLMLSQTRIEQRKALVESGKMAEGELFELQAQASKEELNRIQADNNLKLALLDLAQIMELRDFENLDVEVPENLTAQELSLLDANSVYESAIQHRAEIKSAEQRLGGSMTNVQLAKSAYYPTLSLGASMGTGYYSQKGIPAVSFGQQLSDKIGAGVGLSLRVPIYSRGEVNNNVRTSQLAVDNSRLDLENVKIELRKNIQQAYYNASAARTKWNAADKSVQASREAYRFASQKYESGRSNVYELYQAKSNLTQALSDQTRSKYEYVFRMKILELLR